MHISNIPQTSHIVYVARPSRGMAVASICLGVVGAVIGLIPILGVFAIACGILAVIFGISGARKVRQSGGGRALAVSGWILGLVAITLGVIGMVIVDNAIDQFEEDMNEIVIDWEQG